VLKDHADTMACLIQVAAAQLSHFLAVDLYLATGGALQQVDAADQGRFPCAG